MEDVNLNAMLTVGYTFDIAYGYSDHTLGIEAARKSIVTSREIKVGKIFSEENLAIKRPRNGISPMRWDEMR
jgi:sialic acid synthase SpsE